ncbi:MAG: hypothetical protein JWM16_3591 [Verrucomicrobiales bacterium]|nr:hypothetical protein [Verrucomicrobiales bacterium]
MFIKFPGCFRNRMAYADFLPYFNGIKCVGYLPLADN